MGKKDKIDKEDSRAQLASLQQLRTHWSGVITSHLSLALTINVAIISYFLNSFIDTMEGEPKYTLLFAMAALTSIIFGLWRLYAHYLDHTIANLYPGFLKNELRIGLPENEGTIAYLKRELVKARWVLDDPDISHKKKVKGLIHLVHKKRIGTRGHLSIDITIIAVQLVMNIVIPYFGRHHITELNTVFLAIGALGLSLTVLGMFRFQKWVRKKDVEQAFEQTQ